MGGERRPAERTVGSPGGTDGRSQTEIMNLEQKKTTLSADDLQKHSTAPVQARRRWIGGAVHSELGFCQRVVTYKRKTELTGEFVLEKRLEG